MAQSLVRKGSTDLAASMAPLPWPSLVRVRCAIMGRVVRPHPSSAIPFDFSPLRIQGRSFISERRSPSTGRATFWLRARRTDTLECVNFRFVSSPHQETLGVRDAALNHATTPGRAPSPSLCRLKKFAAALNLSVFVGEYLHKTVDIGCTETTLFYPRYEPNEL